MFFLVLCEHHSTSCICVLSSFVSGLPSSWSFALANTSDLERENQKVVLTFYEALASGDVVTLQKLLVADNLEWWFHGPPAAQYLRRLLIGEDAPGSFAFEPLRVRTIGENVFAEGYDNGKSSKCWVHVWTVREGKIVQLREYFNTELTVFGPVDCPLWSSQLGKDCKKSIPSLILAV
ncbi:hypothetical protein KP509_05G023300 [Ceratopteris richardii]|uniref:Wound-induced protein 1 n=1 Tax=Ceratopteris richardii TaxID=49495 RepID=A0A8T2UPI9_CERRI|nr:hypothetical protein KP509_05G023300 [Ceratopteris richardii]